MTESIQLNASGIDTLVDVFTSDSGINYANIDVDNFIIKREKTEQIINRIIEKYSSFSSIFSTLKSDNQVSNFKFDSRMEKDKFDLFISNLLPYKSTVSNIIGRVIYHKNENFYSYLDITYDNAKANNVHFNVVNYSYAIKKLKSVAKDWNQGFYDDETAKGAELIEKDNEEIAEQKNNNYFLNSYVLSFVKDTSTPNNITVLLPFGDKIDNQDVFKINSFDINIDNGEKELDSILKNVYSNLILDIPEGYLPEFAGTIPHVFANPYRLSKTTSIIVDHLFNNLHQPFCINTFKNIQLFYGSRLHEFLSRYIKRALINKIKSVDPDSPYIKLLNFKKKGSLFGKTTTFAKIEKVIEKVSSDGIATRYVLVTIDHHSLILTVSQDSLIYEGMDEGNYILLRTLHQGNFKNQKHADIGFIVRKENKEYLDIFEDNVDSLISLQDRSENPAPFERININFLRPALESRSYYGCYSHPVVGTKRITNVIKTLLNTKIYNHYNSSMSSLYFDADSLVIVDQDLELFNQAYRNLLNANKVRKTIQVNDPNIDIQINIENENKQKLDIFRKGIDRLSKEGKPFSISINDNQAIQITEREIKFGNQTLKSTCLFTAFPHIKSLSDKVDKREEDVYVLKRKYPTIGSDQRVQNKLFKNYISMDDIDLKDFTYYTSTYNHETGTYVADASRTADFKKKLLEEINSHNRYVKPYIDTIEKDKYGIFSRPLDFLTSEGITLPTFSLFNSYKFSMPLLNKQLIAAACNVNVNYSSEFHLLNSNVVLDPASNLFLMEVAPNINDIDFNVMVNRFIDKVSYFFVNQKYSYFDDNIRPNLPISKKVKLFEATIGSVSATLSVSKSLGDVITWYVNNKRVRRDEIRAILQRALCFNAQNDYNSFVEDISHMSLRARNLVAKGLDITIKNSSGKNATVLLEFERKDKIWYLVIRDTNNKKIKELEIEGGVVKFANSLIKKDQNDNRHAKKRIFSSNGFMSLMSGVNNFTVKDAQCLIANGLKTINEAIARSRKLLEDTARMVNAQYITHTYGNKTIKGYVVTGMSGARYLVACSKETFASGYNGTEKFAGVYSMPALTKICIVDKSIDQNGFDIIVNRMLALKNDTYIAESVTTLKPYVNKVT